MKLASLFSDSPKSLKNAHEYKKSANQEDEDQERKETNKWDATTYEGFAHSCDVTLPRAELISARFDNAIRDLRLLATTYIHLGKSKQIKKSPTVKS
ncbi:hypothetical protein BTUL_0034g00270 [Botrytis tulipae]|uniref:Uncharacterized protein n=1 Tax=Botrytis tulipae TaxID=87230 RepID=A0A4Z1EUH3_9HELO|nr:hypothetical protein BTUL_0034g00270 [Botrytis tulipae]